MKTNLWRHHHASHVIRPDVSFVPLVIVILFTEKYSNFTRYLLSVLCDLTSYGVCNLRKLQCNTLASLSFKQNSRMKSPHVDRQPLNN